MTEDQIKNVIKEQFEIGDFLVDFIKESSDNILYKIVTLSANYVLRISKRNSITEDDIMFELEAIRIANEGDVKTVGVVKTKSQKTLVKFEENFLVLFKFITGVHINYSEKLGLNLEKVFNAGKTLGTLHKAWENKEIYFSKTRNMFSEYERFIKNKEFFIKNFSNGQSVSDAVDNILKKIKNKNNTDIIHNDFRPHNLFFSKNKDDNDVVAVLDFDWSCRGNFLKDLAHSIIEWSLPDGSIEFEFNIAQAFLDGYLNVRKVKIGIEELKDWMVFACISDAITYWVDKINTLDTNKELSSFMYKKAAKVVDGMFNKLMFNENRHFKGCKS